MMERAEPEASGFWHGALFYRGAAEFDAAVRRFVETAALAGAGVLVACPGASLGRLRVLLDGLDAPVTWTDTARAGASPGRLIHQISSFTGEHPGGATCVQQAVWRSRREEEVWAALQHEALVNLALDSVPVRMLCPYDADLPGEIIACAEATHPVIARSGRWQPSPAYRHDGGLRVPGAFDRPLPPPPATAWVLAYHDDLSTLRRLVSQHAQAAGLPPDRAGDLLIAVSELAGNTLTHADGHGTLTLWTARSEVICQISDGGYITDPLAGRLRPGPAADGGGRGLWLAHQLCDLVQIRTSPAGTTIRVHMGLTA